MKYLAHIDTEHEREQTVLGHLTETAEIAAGFAEPFGAAETAYRCGMLHDIGKYSQAFQKRLSDAKVRVDHSTAGAVEAFGLRDVAAAFCIAGHHGGIPDMGSRADGSNGGTLLARVKRRSGKEIEDYSAYKQEVLLKQVRIPNRLISITESAFFYTHMLYSCLVDADWLDTERFMSGGDVERGTGEAMELLWKRLDEYVAKWWDSPRPIDNRRCEILRELMDAGARDKGIYTLTVPTGGGKTVSSMAFALRHALQNHQRRVIYVIPYTSIIEQTQEVFEKIFGPQNVVAHYANVEYDTDEYGVMSREDRRRYLASENWDAPIILTTAVQFFESLFGNKPSRCRKLHNIVESVIIFDEAQMLPVNYLRPCVRAVTELVKNYCCTAVLCTATQPSLGKLIEESYPPGAQELCTAVEENYEFFRRVKYKLEGTLTDGELVSRMALEHQVLCVVNSRAQAQALFAGLPQEGRFHLSTTMTPTHRRETLGKIRSRLKGGEPCRVVSTSIVEAGVDVDFPCVYRAVAGLDSIIQAGGRCNRENNNPAETSLVHVFDTETKPPQSLKQNICAARWAMERHEDIASPAAIKDYFDFLLGTLKDDRALDEKNIMRLINDEMAFETVAKKFRLIEDNSITVYIPLYGGKELVDQLLTKGPSRRLMRRLGQYAVSVYEYNYNELEGVHAVRRIDENSAVLLDTGYYDDHTGLSLSPEGGKALFDVK